MASWAGKDEGVIEGPDGAVEKVHLMEISGNGQNMHFKFLPEGV